MNWQIEAIALEPDDERLPYVWTEILKQNRKAEIPLPVRREVADILKQQIGQRKCGPVWPWKNPPYRLLQIWEHSGRNGRNGRPERVRYKGTLYKVAGLSHLRPFHDYRKTVKLELKRSGLDRAIIKQLQGHKSDYADDWYTWFQGEDMEAGVKDSYLKDRDQTQGPK